MSENENGSIISFMGIEPEPGEYWTSNRHDCSGRAQIQVKISQDRSIERLCPTCGQHPAVFFECGQFSYFGGKIIF